MSEKIRHKIITPPIDLANAALEPVSNIKGKKAAMVVSTPKVAGTATRFTPRITFSVVCPYFSISLWADSPITMASSTTIPNTKIKANKETMLMVISKPPRGINNKPPKNDTGKPIITQKANLTRRNKAKQRITNKPPHAIFSSIIFRRPSK